VFELLVFAAAQAAAPPPAAKPAPPPLELLEFLAEWTEDEASLIDEAERPVAKSPPPAKQENVKRGTEK
jgi:hypothetical protein